MLLTNIAFIAWQYVQEEGKQEVLDVYRDIDMVNQGLTILSELPPGEQPALRDRVDETVAGVPPIDDAVIESALTAQASETVENVARDMDEGKCFRIDGIEEHSALEQLQRLLQSLDAKVTDKGEKQAVRTNYWVFLPPYPNRAKADEAAAILSRKRVKDFFVVRSGENQNAISLGVFSTRDRAELRYKQIVDLRVRLRRPRVETVESSSKQYFVRYTIDSSIEKISNRLSELKYPPPEEIRCK